MRFFSIYVRVNYLRTEIISTTNVAKAIIKDNASYTLMLITSLSQGKPNTSNYLIYSLANLCSDYKKQGRYVCMHIFMVLFLLSYGMNKKARMFLWREYTRFMYDMFLLK